jgi:ABC-type phosphate/phosphonate transport system substrate-binding protein
VTFSLLARHRPAATAGLRVLARSRRAPALPYVTRIECPPERLARLRAGLTEALADSALTSVRKALLIASFSVLSQSAYRYIVDQERRARMLGYAVIR